jgi:hypothetical protein
VNTSTLKTRSPLTGRFSPKATPDHLAAAHFLSTQGLSSRRIAERIGLHHATVSRLLKQPFDAVMWRALHDPDVLALAAAEEPEAP